MENINKAYQVLKSPLKRARFQLNKSLVLQQRTPLNHW